MSDAAKVREARARGEADAAKARLLATAEELKARLAPGKLTSDAVQAAKDKSIVLADDTVSAVKEKPFVAAGIATAAALFLARRPLFGAVGRWFGDKDGSASRKTRKSRREAALEKEDQE